MNELEKNENYDTKTFENIKHIDEHGMEFWYARELQKVLEYRDWRNFKKVINKAMTSAQNSIEKIKIGLLKSTSQSKLVKEKRKLLKIINFQDIYAI